MTKNVLILTNSSSGLYNFRHELIESIIDKGYNVIVSTPMDRKTDELKSIGCHLIDTKIERRQINPIKDCSLLLKYYEYIKKYKPQMVITYTIKPNIYGGMICRILKTPYAANITGLGTTFEKDGFLKKVVTCLYKVALKKAHCVFFENSTNMQLFVSQNIIKKNQAVLLDGAGVNLQRYSVLEYPQHNQVEFLFIGRIMKEKGIDELFQAMRLLVKNHIDCKLSVLGSYDEKYDKVIEEAEKEGWLTYHGYQNDIRPYIQGCDCFVLPSWHEGMANTNLECASSGRPVITSDIAGCREAVKDQVSGFLCKPKDAEDLFAQMKAFCLLGQEQRRKMGLEGRRLMEKVFDKNKVVSKTIKELSI